MWSCSHEQSTIIWHHYDQVPGHLLCLLCRCCHNLGVQASCRYNYHHKDIRSSMNHLSLGKNYFYWNNASTLNTWAWQFIVNKLNLLFIDSSINMASSDIDQLLSYPRQHQRCLNQKETKSLRNFQKIKPGGILWTQEVEGISDEVREDTGWWPRCPSLPWWRAPWTRWGRSRWGWSRSPSSRAWTSGWTLQDADSDTTTGCKGRRSLLV